MCAYIEKIFLFLNFLKLIDFTLKTTKLYCGVYFIYALKVYGNPGKRYAESFKY